MFWLGKFENVSLGHGVSLLRWRSGGVEYPHDTPPYPFMPSPTFGLSSMSDAPLLSQEPGRAFLPAKLQQANEFLGPLWQVDDPTTLPHAAVTRFKEVGGEED